MSQFGKLLREYRLNCNDPGFPGRKLSQPRLGELLGRELGMSRGYSAAAVSDWEHGKSKINADQRLVLTSLVRILHQLDGLKTSSEANRLLEAGNYRALDSGERKQIFPEEIISASVEVSINKSSDNRQSPDFPWEGKFFEFDDQIHRLLADAKEGPSPSWPRVIASLLKRFSNYWSVSKSLVVLIWFWLWLLTWRLISPSLRLPFTSRENAQLALELYIVGTLVTPVLIGVLTNPKSNEFWQKHGLATNYATYLYTYQGAGIGFHLGYFGVLAINLLGYYMHFHFALWFELIETGIILLWGYLAAHIVPYNLWRAYGRLALADGWIFFVFLLLGPMWAFFFFEFYPVFFSSVTGGITILLAITLLILIMAWRQYRNPVSK